MLNYIKPQFVHILSMVARGNRRSGAGAQTEEHGYDWVRDESKQPKPRLSGSDARKNRERISSHWRESGI